MRSSHTPLVHVLFRAKQNTSPTQIYDRQSAQHSTLLLDSYGWPSCPCMPTPLQMERSYFGSRFQHVPLFREWQVLLGVLLCMSISCAHSPSAANHSLIFLGCPLSCKLTTQADVYSFAMICYELFEGVKPFAQMDAMSAARAASLFDRRPSWGKVNRRAFNLACPQQPTPALRWCRRACSFRSRVLQDTCSYAAAHARGT